jgi:hypothetical protein
MRYNMCGWCRRFNPVTLDLCRQCGHQAHVGRAQCTCLRCSPRALPAPDPLRDARLGFARWLVVHGHLRESI